MERGKGKTSGLTTGSTGTLLTGKTFVQSEPDIISPVVAHATKRGIAPNGLTQGNALRSPQSAQLLL